jgi:amino acid adenylation domain-containing protein
MMKLLHHLVGDHVTMEVMEDEIQAHLLGEGKRLPESQPFRNLVAQARLGVSREEHEEFFRQLLGDVDEPTAPFGLLDVRGDGTGIEEARMQLDEGLAHRVREQARKLGVSAASLYHVVWAQVLAQVSGREDVVFGTVLLGRMQGGEGAERVMGLFINTLPVRIQIGNMSAEASIRFMHKQLADLLRHEHASLALAQRCSAVRAPAPLFSALLNYRHSTGGAQAGSNVKARAQQGIRRLFGEERTNYPFGLAVDEMGNGFGLTVRVKTPIEPMRVCDYVRTALESLVEALETSSSMAVRRLNVLPERERQQVLHEWNATQVESRSELCIHELFEEQVSRTPEAIAVAFESESLNYEELNRRANQLAHYLRGEGLKPDTRVAICVERGLEMMVGLLAVLKAGGAYVPLDPAYPVERLQFMLEDSGAVALLTQGRLRELFTGSKKNLTVLDLAATQPEWKGQPEKNLDLASIGLTAGHLAYVIYTSGSTGIPKGVMVEHRNLVNYMLWAGDRYYRQAGAGSPAVHSIGFDGLVTTLFGPLIAGQTLTLLARGDEMDSIARLCSSDGAPYTLLKVTPSHLKLLNRVLPESGRAPTIALMIGGEALVPVDVHLWQKRFPEVRLINHFGPTEGTVGCCTFEISAPVMELASIPIGRPIANTKIYVLDKHGEPAPVGIAGELHIGGAGVTRGYLNRADLTAERFVSDPFAGQRSARMYRTGDMGRWLPDGTIEFLGRNDFQVKIRGFRIELGEIETRLAEHRGVREAVVVVREEPGGDKRLVAYYTDYRNDETVETDIGADELRKHVAGKLPEYMVPGAYVRLGNLPLTPNGKLDRKALPSPEADAYAVRGYEEPVGETERVLAGIWSEVLKVERVGRYDDFFDLGGHSLLAIKVITQLRQALNAEVTISGLFANPVLASLAEHVLNLQREQVDPDKLADVLSLMRDSYVG